MSLTEVMFNKLLEVISSAGEDVTGVTHQKVVDNSFASKGYRQWLNG